MSIADEVSALVAPKDRRENLKYRVEVLRMADEREEYRAEMLKRSRDDFIWFTDTFCSVFEPRPDRDDPRQSAVLPFAMWPHQERAYRESMEAWGFEDIKVLKSRSEGASWVYLTMITHGWLFTEMQSYGLVSRTESAADNPDDPDSLMWKVSWQIKQLPNWIVSDSDFIRNRRHHSLTHRGTNSTIIAYSATGDVARGGRKTVFLMDEFASFRQPDDQEALNSTQQVSNCRIFLSTPKGPSGAFYDMFRSPDTARRIELWWHQNPTKNQGMYRVHEGGKLELIDKPFWKTRAGLLQMSDARLDVLASQVRADDEGENQLRHEFMLDGPFVKYGQLRSIWYDKQCRRAGATPRSIAQELDGDFGGSASRYFSINKVDQMIEKHCVSPVWRGSLAWNDTAQGWNPRLIEQGGAGRLQIWSSLNRISLTPDREEEYFIGADVAAGTGGANASNSVAAVIGKRSKQLVALYADPGINPHEFADFLMALAWFYHHKETPAVIAPERNGAGQVVCNRLRDLGFRNFYLQRTQDTRNKGITKKIGFWSNNKTKPPLLGELNRAISTEELIIPDKDCLEETKHYMLMPNGKVEHDAATNNEDPSGALDNHGDRVIAVAVGWWALVENFPIVTARKPTPKQAFADQLRDANPNSIAGRLAKTLVKAKSKFW